jgi:hypothetical protein
VSLNVDLNGGGWSDCINVNVEDDGWFIAMLTSPSTTAVQGG